MAQAAPVFSFLSAPRERVWGLPVFGTVVAMTEHPLLCSRASEAALELPGLLRVLTRFAATDLGERELLLLRPVTSPELLRERRAALLEVGALLEQGRLVPSLGEPLAPLLSRLHGATAPDGKELVRLGRVLSAARAAADRIASGADRSPCLDARASKRITEAVAVSELARRIARVLDDDGEVREDASPRLSELRQTVRQRRDGLYHRLGNYVRDNREQLAEETVSIRDGRLTVLLPSGHRGRLEGLVHARSASGRSFYFEPLEAVDDNNELQRATGEELQERRRLFDELVTACRGLRASILGHIDLLVELDVLSAAWDYGQTLEASVPELEEDGVLSLEGARHPLLDPALRRQREAALGTSGHEGDVVPLDLTLQDERILVVTGPNAGGKTVALKTVGLLAASAHCGLPIPAGPSSRIPLLKDLVAVVGDEQDLLADRSTFSGRLLRLDEAWRAAGPRALVLLDEIGSGTAPEEGAALSVALLEELSGQRTQGILVTHLTQVALAALEIEGAGCAAMEFDATALEPTFRLRVGPPGGSEAVALARRLGLSDRWLRRAESLLGDEQRELRRLLRELEAREAALAEQQREMERRLLDQKRLDQRRAQELEGLVAERRALRKTMTGQFEQFRREVRDRFDDEVARLRGEIESGRRRNLSAEATARLFEEPPSALAPEPPEPSRGPVRVGDRVRHQGLSFEGVVEELERGRAAVRVRGKRLVWPAGELVRVEQEPRSSRSFGGRAPRVASRTDGGASRHDAEEPSVTAELNLVGQRVEPALEALDRYLDRALVAGTDRLRVIHGHGSGRLRSAVRDHLRSHPSVASFAAAERSEGGDGATIVELG